VVLAVAVAAALLAAQHLKDKPPLIDGTGVVWHPARGLIDPRTQPISFSFYARYDDRLDVAVVAERSGAVVATLARDVAARPFERLRFHWAGAASAPPGAYEVRVHFARLDRTTTVPSISFDLR
jgi:hypothetical protein